MMMNVLLVMAMIMMTRMTGAGIEDETVNTRLNHSTHVCIWKQNTIR